MDIRKLKKKKEKAIAEGNHEQLYHYCKDLGDEYLREEDNESAFNEYKEAEGAAKKLNNSLYVAVINRMIGETLCATGEFEKAVKHQKIHLQYAREEENLIEEQRALATLGRTYFVQAESFSDSEHAERKESLRLSHQYYLESLEICKRLPLSNQISQKTLAEMKSRLFLNLGLTSEAERKTNVAIEYISKAVTICKNMDLWDELCRCYTAQGSIYSRQGITGKAISIYDEALKIAERVEKKVQATCEILSLKADALLLLGDYNAAKQALAKAYKMKTSDLKDREEIKEKLKIVVLICKSENKLLEIPKNAYETRKKLNETLGDCCVRLKNFEKAVSYYKLTLECAEAMGADCKELVPIYYSLSQTYKDNQQYKQSIEYSRKELDLVKDNSSEACKILLNIADTMELLKEPFEKILAFYKECHLLAKKSGDFKIEVLVLKAMKKCQIDYGREELAEETDQELRTIQSFLPETEEEFDDTDVDAINDDINLDELSDLYSEDDDEKSINEGRPRRQIMKSNIYKRNANGEYPLHIAAIRGNVDRIESLITQGHPVNVYDYAGWSPLHEACNHGQIEAARVLIELGANVNDRGGECTDGLTPLLDAATNGKLELIELLLDKGASLLAKTNDGQTVLDCLMKFKERTYASGEKFDHDYEINFDKTIRRIKDDFSKVGQNFRNLSKTDKQLRSCQMKVTNELLKNDLTSMSVGSSRKRPESEIRKSNSSSGAAQEYRDAMQALRRRTKEGDYYGRIVKQKKPALLADDEIGDDWLENDLGDIGRRPTKRRCEEFVGQQLRQKKNMSTMEPSSSPTTNLIDFNDDLDNLFSEVSEPFTVTSQGSPENELFVNEIPKDDRLRSCSKFQKSLLSMNFKRSHSSILNSQTALSPCKQLSEPLVHTTSQFYSNIQTIKVRIEGKLFLIPVPLSSHELDINWLITEASRRYQNSEGVLPTLQLSTQEDAILDCNDPLSIILGANEICGTVLSWKLAPIVDRYKETCSSENIEVDHYVVRKLDECQANGYLEIQNHRLSRKVLTSLFKAIQHHQNLQQISFTGVFLNDHDMKILADYLSKLQIRSLNLSVNNITNNGLSHLIQSISSGSFTSIEEIDLSHNPLGENSGQNLAILSQNLPYLRSLNLCFVGLTSQCLYGSWNFVLDFVEWLDISFNKLEREGISKFFAALNSNKIRYLNISNTGGSEVMREFILFLNRGQLDSLESLYLSGLDADDDDVEQIVQSLQSAFELIKLDLSNNRHVSLRSYEQLSRLDKVKELHLAGCSLLNDSNNLLPPINRLSLSSDLSFNNFKEAPYSFVTNMNHWNA